MTINSSSLIRQLSEKADSLRKEVRDLDSSTAEGQEKIKQISDELAKIGDQVLAESRKLAALSAEKQDDVSDPEARDLGRFDYAKVLRSLVRGGGLDGLERELAQEGERELRQAGLPFGGGVMLPRLLVRRSPARALEQRTRTVSDAATGGVLVRDEWRVGLLDDLFDQSVLVRAGATVLDGLEGNLPLPRILSDPAATEWVAETGAAKKQSPTFTAPILSPKRQAAYIDISEQLLLQSGEVVAAALRRNLTGKLGSQCESAYFHGTGGQQPNGILTTTGIGSVAAGAVSLKMLVDLETAVDSGNALTGSLGYFSNGAVRGALKQTQIATGTDSRRLLEGNAGEVNGYAAHFTNAISRTLGSGGDKSALIFGNAADYFIGLWGGLRLDLERGRNEAINGLYTLVANVYSDGGVARPASFAACTEVKTA